MPTDEGGGQKHDMRRRERERERLEWWVGARSGLVNLMKEYGLCPDSKDFKLEGGMIRFAYQKMWGMERKEGQS